MEEFTKHIDDFKRQFQNKTNSITYIFLPYTKKILDGCPPKC